MKLLVHNFLSSQFLKGVATGYPLKIMAESVTATPREYNADFIKRTVPKLDYTALKAAADSIGYGADLPAALVAEWCENEDFLKQLHHVLVELEVDEGYLECPETGRKFTIKKGIPNMLVNEDEVAN